MSADNIVRFGKGLKLDSAESAQAIVQQLDTVPPGELKALEFTGNTLGVEASRPISDHLATRPELEEAHFSDMFTGRLKTEIPPVLKNLFGAIQEAGAWLTLVDLSDNAFGPIGVEAIAEFLTSESAFTLKVLKLNNNGLGPSGGKMLAEALDSCYELSSAAGYPLSLEVFVSGRGRLEDEGATALAKVFAKMGTLKELSMPQNGIRPNGIKALAAGIANNTELTNLNLSDNTFTNLGGNEMATALVSLQKLEVINFDDCLIRSAAFKQILDALKSGHPELKELHFGGNELSKGVTQGVVDIVRSKAALRVLNMNCNGLGESGVEFLQQQLQLAGKEDILESLSDDEGSGDSGAESDTEQDGAAVPECDQQLFYEEDEDEGISANLALGAGPSADFNRSLAADRLITADNVRKLATQDDAESKLLHVVETGDPESVVTMLLALAALVESDESYDLVVGTAKKMVLEHFGEWPADVPVPLNFINVLSPRIGLVKNEDKSYSQPEHIYGVLFLLKELANEKVFDATTKRSLQFLLTQPNEFMDARPDLSEVKAGLLNSLFRSLMQQRSGHSNFSSRSPTSLWMPVLI